MEYELMFLIADDKKLELDRIKDDVKTLVTTAGGEWTGDSIQFERKLSYYIKHNWKGTYFVQRFTLPDKDTKEEGLAIDEMSKDVIGEITRQMNLQKDILRYIVVTAEGLPTLATFAKQFAKEEKAEKTTLKEKGEKIDEKLEEALNI